jgi:aromatic ring-opening dioxygenase LigB subunit
MNFPEKWALIASGDLSHCLSQDAPGGFTPQGAIHDQAAQKALEISSPEPLFALSTSQIEQAGECGLRSLLVFLGLVRGEPIETLSYEAPFGVGYCTAFWHGEKTRKGMGA